jgi:hypothetical protein
MVELITPLKNMNTHFRIIGGHNISETFGRVITTGVCRHLKLDPGPAELLLLLMTLQLSLITLCVPMRRLDVAHLHHGLGELAPYHTRI